MNDWQICLLTFGWGLVLISAVNVSTKLRMLEGGEMEFTVQNTVGGCGCGSWKQVQSPVPLYHHLQSRCDSDPETQGTHGLRQQVQLPVPRLQHLQSSCAAGTIESEE